MAFLQESGDDKFAFHAKYIGGHPNLKEWVFIVVDDYDTVTTAGYFDSWTGTEPNAGDILTVYQVTDRRDLSTDVDCYRLKVIEWNVSYRLLGGSAIVGNQPFATTGFTVLRSLPDRAADHINLLDTSLTFDDEDADQDSYFEELLDTASSEKKRIVMPEGGRTLYVNDIRPRPVGDLFLDFQHGLTLHGRSDGVLDVILIDMQDAPGDRAKLIINNLWVNNSERPFADAEASGTALGIIRADDFIISGFRGIGGADLSTAPVSGFGDSGITVLQCHRGRILWPFIEKQPDLGIYISGGSSTGSTDDLGDIEIYAPYIRECAFAIANKRQGRRVSVFGGTIINCRVGIGAVTAQEIGAGRELSVIGTRFKRISSRAILASGECNLTVSGVQIEDFGFNPVTDGEAVGSPAYAIQIQGPSRARLDFSLKMRDWEEDTTLEAVRLTEFTENAVTYTPTLNHISCTVQGITAGIVEDANCTGNHYDITSGAEVTIPVFTAASSTSRWTERTELGQKIENATATAALDVNRDDDTGPIVNYRNDGTTVASVLATVAGHGSFSGAARPPEYTVAQAEALPVQDRDIIYVSNGNAGSPCLAVGVGASWLRIALGAAISAT